MVARPASPSDCLPPAFLPLAGPDLWIASLTVGNHYLADLNDDPEAESAFDAGLELWPICIEDDGTAIQLTVSGRNQTVSNIGHAPTVDHDEISGLTTYGNVATLWSSVVGSGMSRAELLQNDALPWWLSHGYKEPYLVGHAPTIDLAELTALIRDQTEHPVEASPTLFVPHRIRIHQRYR